MQTPPSGASGFVARNRSAVSTAVASLTGAVTAAAAVVAWLQTFSVVDCVALSVSVVLAAALAFWQTRHSGLAAAIALTPVPGLIWAAPLSAGSRFFAVPFAAYGFGVVLASHYTQQVMDRGLGHARQAPLWRTAGLTLALGAVLAVMWFAGTHMADAALQAVADTVGVIASVVLLLPLAVGHMHCDEVFVAKVNRLRERRARFGEWLGQAAVPRWGLSLTGIALVFLALGWFGADTGLRDGGWRYVLTVFVLGGAFAAVAGGWREGLGLSVMAMLTVLIAVWWRSYDMRLPYGAVAIWQGAVLTGFLGLVCSGRMALWRRASEPSEMVRRRALEAAAGVLVAAVAGVAAVLPIALHAGGPVIVLVLVLAAGCGALLLPVLLTALETLVPRQKTVDDVFAPKR